MVLYTANTLSNLFQWHALKIVHEHVHALEQKRGFENDNVGREVRERSRAACASVRVRFTAIGSRDYSETTIQRKARFAEKPQIISAYTQPAY